MRGIFILRTDSVELDRDDPAVKAGRLAPEFMKWYVEKTSLE